MKDAYAKLMTQQHTVNDHAFYEKLENTPAKKIRTPLWKAVVAAACILLLIPVTVWATEYLFGIVTVRTENEPISNGRFQGRTGIGLDIHFDNIQCIPADQFSEKLQKLENSTVLYYDSWEEAAQDLGIELISNDILSDAHSYPVKQYFTNSKEPVKHCFGNYAYVDGKLYTAVVGAVYQRNDIFFELKAKITAEHPLMTKEKIQSFHEIQRIYPNDPVISEEQYYTQNGIPITLLSVDLGDHTDYSAHFAVNGVSYQIQDIRWDSISAPMKKDTLLEVLEGFTLK